MEFFSNRIKVTSKWPIVMGPLSRKRKLQNGSSNLPLMNGNGHHHTATTNAEPKDVANFAGQM